MQNKFLKVISFFLFFLLFLGIFSSDFFHKNFLLWTGRDLLANAYNSALVSAKNGNYAESLRMLEGDFAESGFAERAYELWGDILYKNGADREEALTAYRQSYNYKKERRVEEKIRFLSDVQDHENPAEPARSTESEESKSDPVLEAIRRDQANRAEYLDLSRNLEQEAFDIARFRDAFSSGGRMEGA